MKKKVEFGARQDEVSANVHKYSLIHIKMKIKFIFLNDNIIILY